jgi:adenylate cyclase
MAYKIWRNSMTDGRTRLFLSAMIFGLGLLAGKLDLVRKLEWKAEDARLEVRARLGAEAHEDLLLIGIDEESVNWLGQWPFPRSVHGVLMEWLGRDPATRPAVMAWDLLFIDRNFDPELDQAFADGLGAAGFPVVFGAMGDPLQARPGLRADGETAPQIEPLAVLGDQPELAALPDARAAKLPLGVLRASAATAFLDAEADADGVVRHLPLVVRVGDAVYPSLVLRTLLEYWKVGYEAVSVEPGRGLVVRLPAGGSRTVPIDAQGRYRLNYRHEHRSPGNPAGLPTLGYWALYEPLMNRYLNAEEAPRPPTGNKILVVGQVASGLTDIGPSPLDGKSAKVMVHLNALDNILKGDHLRDLPLAPVLAAVLLLGLGAGWVLERRGIPFFSVAVLGSGLVVAAVCTGLLVGWSVMSPLAVPLGAFFVQQGAFATLKIRQEQAKRDRIRGLFATYVAAALVDRMVQTGEEPRLGGVEEEITAYFSDIEGFSSFSEELSPTQLVELMNEYLSACTDIVQSEGGTLDKYIGDAVVAMYGAPLALEHHGHRALVAALRVQRRCGELREKWRAEQSAKGWPDIVTRLRTRIGLNLGRAVVGNMGSHTRFNYTMMGDTVNIAARMESGAKTYGVYTLVTESVVEASRRAEPDGVLFRPLDRIVVKGRSAPLTIHEAMALRADLAGDGRGRECAAIYTSGLERYQGRDWAGAREAFGRSLPLEENVSHNPSKVMLERIDRMLVRPPGADWDGVWRMTSK